MTGAEGSAPPPPPAPPRRGRLRRPALALLALLALALVLEGALLAATAASFVPQDPTYAGPRPLPPDVAARFEYPERGSAPVVVLDAAGPDGFRFVQLLVTTPGDAAAHKVQLLDLAPDPGPGPRPAVVLSPILGGDAALERLIARALVRRGLRATIVLRAESAFDGAAPEARLERVLRTAVIDRRRAIDWLERDPGVDPGRIGALGTSLGALVTTALVAVEPRVRQAALLLAGGDLGDVVTRSSEARIERYVAERAAAGTPRDRLADAIRAAVPSDPLGLAPYVDARRLITVLARLDTVVPYDLQLRMHEALGRPAHLVVPAGHYSAALALPVLLPRVADDLARGLATAP